ncbi:ornithine decarboxylase antizyme 1-like [Oppia nitens]|uniref:ornithine decarboxylase antizyme 1-like n=1 Tax=Oppia nitens TaxID=1686743 RepID=UPI0023DCBA17|nr:ornithine decarboxylase antizyme 1-like [Oppia nitens]
MTDSSVYSIILDPFVITVFPWVRGLSGAPDVPQSQLIDVNRVSSISLSESNILGKYRAPPTIEELTKQSRQSAIRLTLNIRLLEGHDVEWKAIIWKENLLIQIPNGISLDNSKEAFISLLELAEEELTCQRVTVYFDKNRSDRNSLIRLFSFIGFSVLAPNHSMSPEDSSENMLYMAYSISG